MRLLIIALSLVFFFAMTGFVLTNLAARVDIVVWNTVHPDVPVYLLVVLSAFAGCIVVGIIAVAEGANTRLANRRLRREIQQLETEINYLRTQPASAASEEADRDQRPAAAAREAEPDRSDLPSAPVYGADDERYPSDDDDIYSGGRAV